MRFVVLLEDEPSRAEVRPRLMPQHLDFLRANAEAVLEAGPLTGADSGPAGGLWIVEADSREKVDELIRSDPFWPAGLRKSVRVLAWNRVFAAGRPLL